MAFLSECECEKPAGRAEKDAIETEADYVAPERETVSPLYIRYF